MASEGILAFGHDHAGHGRSDGFRAYIETVDEYVDDLIDHCMVRKIATRSAGSQGITGPFAIVPIGCLFFSIFYE